jgi:hypothetical protein
MGLLLEVYEAELELRKLTVEIMDKLIRGMYELYMEGKAWEYIFYYIHLDDFKPTLKYKEINDFIKNQEINIYLSSRRTKDSSSAHVNFHSFPRIADIKLRFNDDELWFMSQALGDNPTYNQFRKIIENKRFDSLLHELQHTYDGWRSNLAAFDGQKTSDYINSIKKYKNAKEKEYNKRTPEEQQSIDNAWKKYVRLQHEINARYTIAVNNIKFTESEGNKVKMLDWDDVWWSFKTEYFTSYKDLTKKDKVRLSRRLYKAYQAKSKKIQKFNDNMSKLLNKKNRRI